MKTTALFRVGAMLVSRVCFMVGGYHLAGYSAGHDPMALVRGLTAVGLAVFWMGHEGKK